MKSPKNMRIIQIDITNACVHSCSNCTRFCGHHQKNFFMDWETYKRAVDSLEGFKGTIGMMGGEPTLHPDFERYARYLHSKVGVKNEKNTFIQPTENFIQKLRQQEIDNTRIEEEDGYRKRIVEGAGLWSALVPSYYKNFEVIQDVFRFQCVNDHKTIMYHSPILFNWQDAGLKKEEWIELRDHCWAQESWSATITPKGAFFCEIAGALDMLLDGPGGWPIEPGWWKRKPEEFGDQLKWCELCGIAIESYTRDANEEIDDMSERMLHILEDIKSPKIKKGQYHIMSFDGHGKVIKKEEDMMEIRKAKFYDTYLDRFNQSNEVLKVKNIDGVLIGKDDKSLTKEWVDMNSEQFDELFIFYPISNPDDTNLLADLQQEYSKYNGKIKISLYHKKGMGKELLKIVKQIKPFSFVVLLDGCINLNAHFREKFMSYVMNPGTVLYGKQQEIAKCSLIDNAGLNDSIIIFNTDAYAVRRSDSEEWNNITDMKSLTSLWDKEKIVPIIDSNFEDNLPTLEAGKRYVVYGLGGWCDRTTEAIKEAGSKVIYYSDSKESLWGTTRNEIEVLSPQELKKVEDLYDILAIASCYWPEIREDLEKLGIQRNKIIVPLDII